MRVAPLLVCPLALQLAACSGHVESDCSGAGPLTDPNDGQGGASPRADPDDCQDQDGDGYPVASTGGPCAAQEALFLPSDCDDRDPEVHPNNVEWIGDGEDWDCDGLDAPELCLDDDRDWVGARPKECAEGNLLIHYRQICDVCSGNETYLLLRVVSVVEPWDSSNELSVIVDRATVYRVDLPDFDTTSAELVVPARFQVDAYLSFSGGCDDSNGFVAATTANSSCTL